MHIEIQIALNYLSTHLFDKLPRRRILLFSEILERNLKQKYAGHWYPSTPVKGSAFRCLKSTDPLIKLASLEANISYNDVMEALPKDLSVWVDPGEVSFRIGESGITEVIWKGETQAFETQFGSEAIVGGVMEEDLEIMKFLWRSGLDKLPTPVEQQVVVAPPLSVQHAPLHQLLNPQQHHLNNLLPINATQQQQQPQSTNKSNKKQAQLMTTAAFAQTKFGSTKLKSNTTRRTTNRMSPTEFSNYIKQKQLQQEAAQQAAAAAQAAAQAQYDGYYYDGGFYEQFGTGIQSVVAN